MSILDLVQHLIHFLVLLGQYLLRPVQSAVSHKTECRA